MAAWAAALLAMSSCGDDPAVAPLVGTISGRVTVEGDGFPGVQVRVAAGEFSETRTTNAAGDFRFVQLGTGRYAVSVSGFGSSIQFPERVRTVKLEAVGQISATVNFEGSYVGSTSEDRDALTTLYGRMSGGLWRNSLNWRTDRPLDQWHGVVTNGEGRVTQLTLVANNLSGSIPPEISAMKELAHLNLAGNRISGAIPPELGTLSALEGLSLQQNDLTGSIPPELADLDRLIHLDLAANNLGGELPARLGDMEALRFLQLSDNRFSGPIPDRLGRATELRHLDLSSNRLDGLVPASLGRLALLQTLQLSNNQLQGPLAGDLGKMRSLRSLTMTHNAVDGPLPPELGSLASLESLSLNGNQLSGSLPRELGALSSLRLLDLSDNRLDGPIPSSLGSLSRLESLRLARNSFSGAVPDSIGSAASLRRLDLRDNELSGPLPATLGRLDSLEALDIAENRISGEIPPELGGLQAIASLDLSDNALTGRLPPELGRALRLTELRVAGNQLAGPLPPELGELTSLTSLQLAWTKLEGLLPRSLTVLGLEDFSFVATGLCSPSDESFQRWLDQITYLAANHCPPAVRDRIALVDFFHATGGSGWKRTGNWLVGESVASWEGVRADPDGRVASLDLRDNALAGPIPLSLAALSALEYLDLGMNELTARVPSDLASLKSVGTMRFDRNPLSGPLPGELTALPLARLDFQETGLCAPPGEVFQEWLESIPDRSGDTCQLPTAVRLDVPMAYATQGVQRQDGSVPLVAGRDALLRVFVTGDPVSFYRPDVEVSLTRDSQQVHSVRIAGADRPLEPFVLEDRLEASYNTLLPGWLLQPGTELKVSVDPDGRVPLEEGSVTSFPADGSLLLDLRVVPAMDLKVVPVLRDGWADSSVFDWTAGMSGGSPEVGLLRKAFPVGDIHVDVRDSYLTTANLQTFEGWGELLREIALLRTAEGSAGYYYGAVAPAFGSYVQGFAFRGLPVAVGVTDPAVMTHEIGHSLGLGHAPCGGANSPDQHFPYAGGRIGIWGTDLEERRLIPPYVGRDVMGYCAGRSRDWLSDYHYEKALEFRLIEEGSARNPSDSWAPDPAARGGKGAIGRTASLVIWGVADGPEGPSFDPSVIVDLPGTVRTVPDPSELVDGAGGYVVTGSDSGGSVLFRRALIPMDDAYGSSHFLVHLPVESAWAGSLARLTLIGPSGRTTLEGRGAASLAVAVDDRTERPIAVVRGDRAGLVRRLAETSGISVVRSNGLPSPETQLQAVTRR